MEEPGPREDDPRFQRSWDAMQVAVSSLVERQPIDTISITLLVQEAGVSRPTFYRHFVDVPDAVRQVALARFSAAVPPASDFSAYRVDEASVRKRTYERSIPILKHIVANDGFYRRVFEEAANSAFIDQLIAFVASRFLPEGFDGAAERAGGDREGVIAFIASGMTWMVLRWLRDGCAEAPEALATRTATLTAALGQPRATTG